MAAWKKNGKLLRHRDRLLDGFAEKGISREFGEALFEQIKGFGDYGFPESHAASFALLVYASSWQKRHYPAHFSCALVNSQPMGFYSPSTILQDAQRHGVEVRDVDVTISNWDCTLEPAGAASRIDDAAKSPAGDSSWPGAVRALRLGFRVIKGFSEKTAQRIVQAREQQTFGSLDDLARRAALERDELEALAEAGALEPLVPGRRQALWKARAPRVGGLFEALEVREPSVQLPALRPSEQLVLDYGRKGLSVADHPLRHLRERLRQEGALSASELSSVAHGTRVSVAGMVICRQQPGTASGVVFITLEDETGFCNLVLFRQVYERLRLAARHSTLLLAIGRLERQPDLPRALAAGSTSAKKVAARRVRSKNNVQSPRSAEPQAVVHVIVENLERLDVPGKNLRKMSRDFH
jgi:error-prone DNA polymerase